MASLKGVRWWHWIPRRTWRIVAKVDAADDVPARLPRNGVVVVGSRQQPKWLAFDCPCRTGHRVMVNLDANRSPQWRFTDERALSVWPSFDCRGPSLRCHYLITRGDVFWLR